MKKRLKLTIIAAALTVCLIIGVFISCSPKNPQTNTDDSKVNTEVPQVNMATPLPLPGGLPEVSIKPDGTVDLDRLSVDLSGAEIPEPGTVIEPKLFDRAYPPGRNEVRIYYGKTSFCTSYTFSDLPPYREEAEDGYFYRGYAISFKLIDEDRFDNRIPSRRVSNERDHAYVLQNTLKQAFIPCDAAPLGDPWLCIFIENGTDVDSLSIGLDGYIYHAYSKAKSDYTYESPSTSPEYDYRSKEPLDAETLAHLTAIAIHYAQYERRGVNPAFFGCGYIDPLSERRYEDETNVLIEYGSETVYVTAPEKMKEFAKIFGKANGLDPRKSMHAYDDFVYECYAEMPNEIEYLMKFTLYPKGGDPAESKGENILYLTEDGRIVCRGSEKNSLYAFSNNLGEFHMFPIAWYSNVELVSKTVFPTETLIEFFNGCK